MIDLKVSDIKAAGWSLENKEDGYYIFLLNDMIFAKNKKDQIDIIYELKFNPKGKYMSILKYFNGEQSRSIYSGKTSLEIFESEMLKLKL